MTQRRFSPRRSSTVVPVGWTHVPPPKPGDRHSWYRCPQIGTAIVGGSQLELRRCSFRCRKDLIPNHPNRKSPHIFDIPQEFDEGFPASAQVQQDFRTQERLRSAIIDAVALLSLKLEIPVHRITQQPLRDFILSMIKIGHSIGERDVAQIVNGFSWKLVSDRMISIGREIKANDFATARETRYVNITVDAGTVLGQAVVHALLTNPYSEKFPIVLSILENTHFNKYQYEELFAKLYATCCENELVVCSFITDGLPAQTAALAMLFEDNPAITSVVHIHCFAHLANLVFVHCRKQSPYLNAIVNELAEMVTLLRTPVVVEELGEKCPSLCPTRWLYVYDVLLWMSIREDKLNAFLVGSELNRSDFTGIPHRWKSVLKILRPLKYLSLAVESSGCALWEVVPIVKSVTEIWKALSSFLDPEEMELLRIMMANFIWRFSGASPATVVTSYSLTEQGRRDLREKEIGFQVRGVPTDMACFTTDRIQTMEAFLVHPDPDMHDAQAIANDAPFDPAHGPDDTPNWDDDTTLQADVVEEEEIGEDLERGELVMGCSRISKRELFELPWENLSKIAIYQPSFATALSEITRVGEALGIQAEYCEQKLRSWLYDDRRITPTQSAIGLSPDLIWRRAPANDEEWRPFADIALRFITIGASEADCERSLSRQKDIQGLHTTNIRMDTLEARMRTRY